MESAMIIDCSKEMAQIREDIRNRLFGRSVKRKHKDLCKDLVKEIENEELDLKFYVCRNGERIEIISLYSEKTLWKAIKAKHILFTQDYKSTIDSIFSGADLIDNGKYIQAAGREKGRIDKYFEQYFTGEDCLSFHPEAYVHGSRMIDDFKKEFFVKEKLTWAKKRSNRPLSLDLYIGVGGSIIGTMAFKVLKLLWRMMR